MSAMGFPQFDIPEPYQPVTGWFAISLRAWRFGDFRRHPFSRAVSSGCVRLAGAVSAGGASGEDDFALLHSGEHGESVAVELFRAFRALRPGE